MKLHTLLTRSWKQSRTVIEGFQKAYSDWQDQIPHILDKYAKGYGSYHEVADFDMCEYGAVERYAT